MAMDGKTQRGSAHGDQTAGHRLGAHLAEDGITLAQRDADGKSNEITAFTPLLDHIEDLDNVVVLADWLHTQRDHATYLEKRGAFSVLPVGGNQPTLFARLDALAWNKVPIGWMTYDRGHGRVALRTIQVLPNPGNLNFPHIRQVFLLERHTHTPTGGILRTEAILGITSLPAAKADPGVPGCLPGLRPVVLRSDLGWGRSPNRSEDGGREELEEFWPRRRLSSAFCAFSLVASARSSSITVAWVRTCAIRSSRGSSSRSPIQKSSHTRTNSHIPTQPRSE